MNWIAPWETPKSPGTNLKNIKGTVSINSSDSPCKYGNA